MKRLLTVLVLSLIISGCSAKKAAPAPSEEKKPETSAAAPAPQMSAEEMMKKMAAAATPGEQHKKLEALVGTWTATSKFWMDPSKAPEETKATSKFETILGKRFVRQEYKGKFMGKPFTGEGLMGYDNIKKKYVSYWYDSMGTGVMESEGTFDATSNAITSQSTFSCPMADGDMHARTVLRFVGKKEFVFEMYGIGPDGKEFKNMEITYKKGK